MTFAAGNMRSSKVRFILLYLRKWDHQPQRWTRGWRTTILVQRNHVRLLPKKNPGLKSRMDEALNEPYAGARIEATVQSKLDERSFLARCPYSWQQIMDRAVDWPPSA